MIEIKIKKIVSVMIAMCIIFVNIGAVTADNENEELDYSFIYEEVEEVGSKLPAQIKEANSITDVKEPEVLSKVGVIFDRDSKEVIWGKQTDMQVPMASTTKIMSFIIVCENSNLEDEVIVSKKAAGIGGSRMGLHTNDKVTVNDLLYGLMLPSGNDAAIALAEHVAGSIEGFAELMNQKAEELELEDTHFVTPHGLDKPEHCTTGYELAVITDYALSMEKFKEVVSTKTYTATINGYPRVLTNTNELLRLLQWGKWCKNRVHEWRPEDVL